jgi:hypothetical protein
MSFSALKMELPPMELLVSCMVCAVLMLWALVSMFTGPAECGEGSNRLVSATVVFLLGGKLSLVRKFGVTLGM